MSKIDDFFSTFTLKLSEKYPRETKLYLYADYFELVALFNKATVYGIVEMANRLNDEGILHLIVENDDEDDVDFEKKLSLSDTEEDFIIEVFDLIRQRSDSFKDDYPFDVVNSNTITIKSELNNRHKLYLFLLFSSNLNLFDAFQADLTTEFEIVAKEALKNYLPDFAIVKGFGENTEFRGHTIDKIRQLAKMMNVDVDEFYLKTVSRKGTQDLGLDIVAWLPLDDNIGNYISVFGQCACGKEWNKKLNETKRYNKFLKIYLSKTNHSMFIPYSIINYNEGAFYEHHELGGILLFERHRILSLIKNNNILNDFKSYQLIEKCVNYDEGLV